MRALHHAIHHISIEHALLVEYTETLKRSSLYRSGKYAGRYMERGMDISAFLLKMERDARAMLRRLR